MSAETVWPSSLTETLVHRPKILLILSMYLPTDFKEAESIKSAEVMYCCRLICSSRRFLASYQSAISFLFWFKVIVLSGISSSWCEAS